MERHQQKIALIAYAWYAGKTLAPELQIYKRWFYDDVVTYMRARGWMRG